MPTEVPVPPDSFLGDRVRSGAFADSYRVDVAGTVPLPEFIEAFYTTRLFKLERWVLARGLNLPSTDRDAAELAQGTRSRFAAWTVTQRGEREILLDAGRTQSWLAVAPAAAGPAGTTLWFGSAVVPRRPGGGFGPVFHVLLGFHRLYSKGLLAAAARRLKARPPAGR